MLTGHRIGRIGTRIDRHRVVDSTNRVAFDAAASGAPDGAVIVADAQRAGRGRLGRAWTSPAGRNLYCSILLRPPLTAATIAALPFLAAVAAREAITAVTGLSAQTKWPNDLLINGRKVGGILVEARRAGGRPTLAVIGIGLNVNWPRRAMPAELRATATSLQTERGRAVGRAGLLAALLNRLDDGYGRLRRDGPARLFRDWSRHSITLRQLVDVTTTAGRITGRAEAVDGAGRLRVRRADGTVAAVGAAATLRLRPARRAPAAHGGDHALRD